MELDCSYCEYGCCELTLEPMGIPMRCIHSEGGRCAIHEDKPASCALYPFVLVAHGDEVFLTIDINCPQAKEAEQLKVGEAKEWMRENIGSLAIMSIAECEHYGWNLKLIGRVG
jgi:Fe-S-cluster containining protein